MSEPAITRRSALVAAGLVAAGGVGGYVAGRNTDAAKGAQSRSGTGGAGYGHPASGGPGKALAKVASIPDGGGVVLGSAAVVLTRSGSQVHAFSAVCTHQGCRVDRVAGGTIDCPCHGSRFDAATGRVVAGPALTPLPPVRIKIRHGQVFRS